ncbi:MAG: PASTA domain-containing protein [Thermoleophilia bacterium]
MRRATLIGALGAAAVAAPAFAATGCGGDDRAPAPAPAPERVRLQITAPADATSVRGGNVDVRGRVTPPAAQVMVLGRPALVTEGRFTAVVPLEPGANVVDVIATAPRRRPALAALRVTRDVLVTVPQLDGLREDEIEDALEPLGLRAEVRRGGGILDLLRAGEATVCEQEPEAGARVRRGRSVEVVVAKRC